MGKDSWSSEASLTAPNSYFPSLLTGLVSYIMSIHIAAQQGEIADKILLPGILFVRNLLRKTSLKMLFVLMKCVTCLVTLVLTKGTVSVMGTGMGMPSISIYARELIVDYGVKKLIRVGTAGSLNEDVHVRELVLAQAAATNSNIIRNDWPQYDFHKLLVLTC